MRDRPMIFSSPMVRAILDGRKTQTRRLITGQTSLLDGGPCSKKTWSQLGFEGSWIDAGPSPAGNPGPYLMVPRRIGGDAFVHQVYPRIQPGDRLWVKEAIQDAGIRGPHGGSDWGSGVQYVADNHIHPDACWPWKRERLPSIFMPRGLCRVMLDVTAVQPERLKDITEYDAKAEGVGRCPCDGCDNYGHREAFSKLWDGLNLKRAPWASNPWCWCITFRRLHTQGGLKTGAPAELVHQGKRC